MPGEHSQGMPDSYYMNEQHKRAMTAPIKRSDEEEAAEIEQRMIRAREAGL